MHEVPRRGYAFAGRQLAANAFLVARVRWTWDLQRASGELQPQRKPPTSATTNTARGRAISCRRTTRETSILWSPTGSPTGLMREGHCETMPALGHCSTTQASG
jgi:hypothetical protein